MASVKKYYGMYRAKVVDPNPEGFSQYGAVRIFLPDFQIESIDPDFDDTKGLLAYPANSPVGGINPAEEDSFYQGSFMIPQNGSFVWVFFENGDVSHPFYFASFNARISEIPKEHTLTDEPHKVFTVIKTNQGRNIIVSDAGGAERIEITGKKRLLTTSNPEGDESSSYTIDGNQTTIWLDERDGKEKLLIKTHKGDYINIDVEERDLNINFAGDVSIKSGKNIYIQAGGSIHSKAANHKIFSSGGDVHIKASGAICETSGRDFHQFGGGQMRLDCGMGKVKISKGARRKASAAGPLNPTDGDTDR